MNDSFVPLSAILESLPILQSRYGEPPTSGLPVSISDGPIATGFRDLDRLLGQGLQRSDMIVLAARPSVGKSMLALNIARYAAGTGARVGIFSPETRREQIAWRLLSAESLVDMHRLRMRVTSYDEDNRIVDSIGALSDMPISVDDSAEQSHTDMDAKVSRAGEATGLDLVVVDPVQTVRSSRDACGLDECELAKDIALAMKRLARMHQVPVIVTCRLPSPLHGRELGRPRLQDLGVWTQLEVHADVVAFIHRPDKFISEEEWVRERPDEPYPNGLADIILVKHRHGPVGTIQLVAQDRLGRFQNPVRQLEPSREMA